MPRSGIVRAAAACLLALCVGQGVGCPVSPPAPAAGAPEYQSPGWVRVPFARVNALGGNLLVERRDLDLDTRLGNLTLGAVWNSADASWRFGFEMSYDGGTLVDASGARHSMAGVAAGRAVPGTIWVRVDARTLRTKGGLVHAFDAEGRLAVQHWASAPYPRLEYRRGVVAGALRLVEIRQWTGAAASTRVATFGYDAAGRLTAIDDRAGRRARFEWNAEGRLAAARDPLDVERGWPGFRYAYAGHQLVAITSSEGVRAEFAYTAFRVSEVRAVGEGDPRVRFAYAQVGGSFRTTLSDPLGNDTRIGWDASRRVLAVENALGERSAWTWQGLRPSSFAAPDGAQTAWVWADDLPAVELQPSGNVVAFAWQPAAENRADPAAPALRRASDSLGLVRENAYDAQGRLVRSTNGAGESWSYAWNAANLLASETDPAGVETRFQDHAEHGHARRVERGGRTETREYDAVGNLRFGSGSAGAPGAGDTGIVSRSYDADRNLAALVLGDLDFTSPLETRTLAVEYRSDGQPLRITRPAGGDSEFGYDALGRARERRDRAAGAWRETRFERDRLGRLTALRRPNGMETRIQYDAAGRRSSLVHLRDGVFESGAGFAYAAGLLTSITDAAHGFAPERYAYDAAGRVRAIAYPGGEGLELAWDLRSRVAEERYLASSGAELRRLRFAYDLADRETELRDGGSVLRAIAFATGRVAEERFGNGLVRSYAYGELDGLLRDATTRDAGGALVERSRYEQETVAEYRHARWRASTTSFGALPATSHEHFLLALVGPDLPGPRVAGFSSDAAGDDFLTYAYDPLGNLTRTGAPGEARERTFHYDAEATRLLRVRRASGATLHEYAYDEAGFAVARDGEAIAWDAGGRAAEVGSRASFRWDALGRLVSATRAGVGQRRLFGGRVRATQGGVPLAIELGALELGLFGNHLYRHLDFRGNVKLVSDAQGRIVAHVRYGPYGAERTDGTPDPEAGFAQGRAAGDLLLLGSRLYDAEVARFLAPDPVLQLVNQYAYADGNPVWYWDPDGRSPQAATAVALGAALGVSVVAALTGNVPLVVLAGSVAVGLVVPRSMTAAAAATGSVAIARYGGWSLTIQAVFTGFAVGQTLQVAFHNDFGDPTLGDVDDEVRDPGGDRPQRREPRFDVSDGGVVGGGGGGSGSGGGPSTGCSPASLTLASPIVARDYLLGLVGLQVLLGGALVWQHRRR